MKKSSVAILQQPWNLVILSILMIFLISCVFTTGLKPTPTVETATETVGAPTGTPEPPTATAADNIAATLTPGPTYTGAPSETPQVDTATPLANTATASPTKTPASGGQSNGQLTGAGPWLLFSSSAGLWAVNADGSALTRLSKEPVLGPADLQQGVSPDGKTLAFFTGNPDSIHNLKLNLMSLPDGKVKTITALTSKATEPDPGAVGLDPKIEAVRAITQEDGLAWSPDGKILAFIGVQSGPTADLYSYTPATGKIAHLSDGPAQAYDPHWSPDGKYIVTFGVTTFGTGAGYTMAGGWATTIDGSQTITLFQPGGSTQDFSGWVNAHTFLINSWTMQCGPQDLRAYDIPTKKETSLVKGCFSASAGPNQTGLILVAGNGDSGGLKGLVSFGPGNFTRKQLSQEVAQSVEYLKQDGSFVVTFENAQAIYDANGEAVIQAPSIKCDYNISVAGFGALYAWTCSKGDLGVWVNGPGVSDNKVFSQGAAYPTWSQKNTLFFFSGQTLYKGPFPDFKPEAAGQIDGDILGWAWAGQP